MNKVKIGLVSIFLTIVVHIGYTQEVNKETVPASLACTNASIQGEAVLVTEANASLEWLCEYEDLKTPTGYRRSLPEFTWSASSGTLDAKGTRCTWSNAEPGLQTIEVKGIATFSPIEKPGWFEAAKPDIIITFSATHKAVFPLVVDAIVDGKINGFEIGDYPDPRNSKDLNESGSPWQQKQHPASYQPPTLFYEVNQDTFFVTIFNDYTLGEFDLDPRFRPMTYPRYIAISPMILRKMDLLKKVMNDAGQKVSKFNIIYGFRSPAYNIGQHSIDQDKTLKSFFSMHMYGKAVDIIVDEDDDLVMDDLDGDGKISVDDAFKFRSYADLLDEVLQDNEPELVGGAGVYYHHDFWERGDYVQAPYVHIDCRGYLGQDGKPIRWVTNATLKKYDYQTTKPVPTFPPLFINFYDQMMK